MTKVRVNQNSRVALENPNNELKEAKLLQSDKPVLNTIKIYNCSCFRVSECLQLALTLVQQEDIFVKAS